MYVSGARAQFKKNYLGEFQSVITIILELINAEK